MIWKFSMKNFFFQIVNFLLDSCKFCDRRRFEFGTNWSCSKFVEFMVLLVSSVGALRDLKESENQILKLLKILQFI